MRKLAKVSWFSTIIILIAPLLFAQEDNLPLSPKKELIEVFGRTFVYAGPPTFETDVVLQKGNDKPQTKIKLKNSSEIKDTPFGAMPAQVPRLPRNDYTSHWLEYYYIPSVGGLHPGDFMGKNLIGATFRYQNMTAQHEIHSSHLVSIKDPHMLWIDSPLLCEQRIRSVQLGRTSNILARVHFVDVSQMAKRMKPENPQSRDWG